MNVKKALAGIAVAGTLFAGVSGIADAATTQSPPPGHRVTCDTVRDRLEKLRGRVEAVRDHIAKAEARVDRLRKEGREDRAEKLQARIDKARDRLADLEARVDKVQARIESHCPSATSSHAPPPGANS